MGTISDNIADCRRRLAGAAAKSGRQPEDITLVAVTKNVSVAGICQALDSGLSNIGENRVQEALSKRREIEEHCAGKALRPVWHMIGHLQSNKARDAVRSFDLIHSLDSLKLAQKVDQEACSAGKKQEALLEVNVSGEKSKYGFSPAEVETVFDELLSLRNVSVRGLMTIAPIAAKAHEARAVFRGLRQLKERLQRKAGPQFALLSMGMSDDFEAAVEEGADIVRLGRAIFGERPLK